MKAAFDRDGEETTRRPDRTGGIYSASGERISGRGFGHTPTGRDSVDAHDPKDARKDIAAVRELMVRHSKENWRTMVRSWQRPRNDEAAWLMYSASYLFNTGGVRWAIDPIRLCRRVPEAPDAPAKTPLRPMDFVLLTHAHEDHVDTELWQRLRRTACTWIVPEHMESFFTNGAGMGDADFIVAKPGADIRLKNITIRPLTSPHWEQLPNGGFNSVASTGYLVQSPRQLFLFPVDVRSYDPGFMQNVPSGATVFAHVFLGRHAALEPNPPLLDEFVEFFLSCRPSKIVLSHLYELGRTPEDCWRGVHAHRIKKAIRDAEDSVEVTLPGWFEQMLFS